MKTIAVLIWLKVIVMILAVLVVLYLLMLMPRLTNRRCLLYTSDAADD